MLQRGAYLVGADELDRRGRHLLAVRATLAGLRNAAVVSHGSAAALHGLPLWRVPLAQVQVTRRPPARSADEGRLHTYVARLRPEDVVVLGGLAVTSVSRTVVDLARAMPFDAALVVADAALASGATTPDALLAVLTAAAGTRGSRSARRVVAAADWRSESVGESRSRAVLIEAGLPLPDLQLEVRRADGVLVGRSDFGWQRQRVLGEFDGRVKYGRLLRPGARIPGTPCSPRSGARTRSGTRSGGRAVGVGRARRAGAARVPGGQGAGTRRPMIPHCTPSVRIARGAARAKRRNGVQCRAQ